MTSKRLGAFALFIVVCMVLVTVLTSCGGGGGSMPTPAPDSSTPRVPDGRNMFDDLNPGPRVDTLKMGVQGTPKAPGQLTARFWMAPLMLNTTNGGNYVETETTAVANVWESPKNGSTVEPEPLASSAQYSGYWVMVGGKGTSSTDELLSATPANPDEMADAIRYMEAVRLASVTTTKRLVACSAFHKGRPLVVNQVDTGGAAGARVIILDASICDGDKILIVGAVEDADAEAWWNHINRNFNPAPPTNAKYRKSGGGNSTGRAAIVTVGTFLLAVLSLPCPAIENEQTATADCPPGEHHLSMTGPIEAFAGDALNFQVISDCPEGWRVTSVAGNRSGIGNGTFQLTMTNADLLVSIADDCGNSTSLTVRLKESPEQSLEVDLTANPSSGNGPLTTTLTASATSTGDITKYDWDFDNNGSYEATTQINETQHTFNSVGNYTVWVRVSDDQGLTAKDSVTITVTQPVEPEDPFAGLATVIISPFSPSAQLLDASVGEITDFEVLGFKADDTDFVWPAGTTFDWILAGDTYHPAIEDVSPTHIKVWSTVATAGDLKVVITNGDHTKTAVLPVTVQH